MKKLLIFSLFLVFSCTKDSDTNESETTTETLYTIGVSAEQGGSVNTSGGDYPLGTVISIEATADSGYEFTGWTGNTTGNDNPLSYTVNGNATITANFSQLVTYSLAVSSTVGGSVNDVNSDYAEGTSVELIAEPDNGYEFVSWTEDGTVISSDGTFQYTVESDALLVANFREIISINFANSNVSPDVNGFNATTDLIIQGNAEIISKGVYLDGQILTDNTSQDNSIRINGDGLSIQEYSIIFYVQTPNGFIESDEYTTTPYEAGYLFDNLNHTLNDETTIVDLTVQFRQLSPLANIEILSEGFLLSKSQASLDNSRVVATKDGNWLEKQIDNINSSSTYYYQAYVENQYGLFKSEIISFNTKAVLGDLGQGGIIVEVDASGFHGKVVATTDYWVQKKWSTEKCGFDDLVTRFDDGIEATQKIIEYFASKSASAPAAEYCYNLEIDGFDDWFLPDYDEIRPAQYFLKDNGYKQKVLETDGVWTSRNENSSSPNVCRAQISIYNNNGAFEPQPRDAERYVIPMREF